MARIITLESPSATQNAVDNMRDDIFMPADGQYSNLSSNLFAPTTPNPFAPKPQSNLFNTTNLLKPTSTPSSSSGGFQMPVGASGTYSSTPKPSSGLGLTGFGFGSKPTATATAPASIPLFTPSATSDSAPAKKGFWASLFGTKDERSEKRSERQAKRGERREARRKSRAERKAARRLRKSNKQLKAENIAKERALALGKSQAEAQALAEQAGMKQKQFEEMAITQAEEKAKADALAKGSTPTDAENLANDAGAKMEQQIFGGYGTDVPKEEVKFWGSMSTGAKIGLIGGGVLVLGLVTWGIIAASKNKN